MRPDAALSARLVVERAGFRLDAGLEADPGEVVALLGPNGAGKSTALRALAGLVPLSSGHVTVEGTDLTTTPTEHRPIGMVFQDYLLFGHMSALDNVAFGPRCQGVGRARARALAADLLDRFGLSDQARLRPRELSGGQAQRVALARALAARPRLLLLDEPLAALDAHTRVAVRSRLRGDLADFDGATVLVTHDPLDAMVLADRVTVIENGAVVQQGRPADIARRPRTAYVARLVGLNLYRGVASGTRVEVRVADGGPVEVTIAERRYGDVFVAFAPRAVALYRERPGGSPRNAWPARIDGVERFGDQVRVHLDGDLPLSADVTPAALAELGLGVGDRIWAGVKAMEIAAYQA
ncbi:ABC transporter ATP-binding protein [Marinactinospora thermotolerans]|uniref:Molybdate transport system ATP-binding protein n=1 Tax=Marinactinospora thermotolerans DSM 45154 TaxID=1122192 RepID=A0A1T4TB21_9ACTN|nr:ABC transporter ATP-binding protein [Marinactinospora thermotolerans]SKA37409.1 molybdate transport system ATP-binding protein [Marinactinospora thermotolerans DSM 45154]